MISKIKCRVDNSAFSGERIIRDVGATNYVGVASVEMCGKDYVRSHVVVEGDLVVLSMPDGQYIKMNMADFGKLLV
jgi:hypothetical protein